MCSGEQLHLARVCYQWVATHTQPPHSLAETGSVSAPLFANPGLELALLGGMKGTWSERAAWLFTQLARACELEAVLIPGYWRGLGLMPGACRDPGLLQFEFRIPMFGPGLFVTSRQMLPAPHTSVDPVL